MAPAFPNIELLSKGHYVRVPTGKMGLEGLSSASTHSDSQQYSHLSPRSDGLERDLWEPVAVCGLATRLPGGIRTAQDFWDLLIQGKDMRAPVPKDRYNPSGFSDINHLENGYFLDEDISSLDTSFFNMRRHELELTDPQQRILLEVVRECLENAGEIAYRGKKIGCYVGTFGDDWAQMMSKDAQLMGASGGFGCTDIMLANRVSYEFDFKGPSMVIKTGCSASLVSLHEAFRALQLKDCDGAIVAGTNLILGPTTTSALASEGVLSPEASCKTFDASADGYARGEAINAVYIKRLSDAVRQSCPIRAIIRNTGTNAGGRGQNLLMPHGPSHEALMRRVYAECGLDPRDTAYVECHGTGTPIGDPIEATAVGNVFGGEGILIGSVKPNVGHSEGASGLTGLIKAILALENQEIPPNIKFRNPNPNIPFKAKRLEVPNKRTALPTNRAQRISVNSFGIGGSNAHVVLESLDQFGLKLGSSTPMVETEDAHLCIFSANSEAALQKQLIAYKTYVNNNRNRIPDISYTLAMRREWLPFRSFAIARRDRPLEPFPLFKRPPHPPSVAMVFSGQGAQWPQMGADLLHSNSGFREDIAVMDIILKTLKHPPNWTIEGELLQPEETSSLHTAEMSQTLCTAVQIALVNAYARCGIQPCAVIGHSSGEIAAAYAAGALSMRHALVIAYYRGICARNIEKTAQGAMAAIALPKSKVERLLSDNVVVACENSPSSVTISGDADAVDQILETMRKTGLNTQARRLRVGVAYHSYHMRSVALDYLNYLNSELSTEDQGEMHTPFFSTALDQKVERSSVLSPSYWCTNLLSPVLFNSSATRLLGEHSSSILLEVGPHPTLAGPLRQISQAARLPFQYIATLNRNGQSHESFLCAIGKLYQYGVGVDLNRVVPHGRVLSNLPLYQWDHGTSHWSESRVSKEWRFRSFGRDPLLGERIAESSNIEPSWRAIFSLEGQPWLRDHKVRDDVVFPMAGYVCMAGTAIQQHSGTSGAYALRDVSIRSALVLNDTRPAELVTNLRPARLTEVSDSDWFEFSISSFNGTTWIPHCNGQVKSTKRTSSPAENSMHDPLRSIPSPTWYAHSEKIGLVYGPAFQGLEDIRSSVSEAFSTATIRASNVHYPSTWTFHPTSLDSCFQLLLVSLTRGLTVSTSLCVPTRIGELYVGTQADKVKVSSRISESITSNNITATAEDGLLLRMRDMQFTIHQTETPELDTDRHASARLHWEPAFDFLDQRKLFTPATLKLDDAVLTEQITLLCLVDASRRLECMSPEAPHLSKFRNWIKAQVHSAKSNTYPLVQDSASYANLPQEEVNEKLRLGLWALRNTESRSLVAIGLERFQQNIENIFMALVEPLSLLLQDGVLAEIYRTTSIGFGPFVRALSNAKPTLRILEIGAGTGGSTATILGDLYHSASQGNPPYGVYTYTDVSASFFSTAQDKFSYAPNMEYKVLDISSDPVSQGFQPASYDLIIGANCVHATPVLRETLQNLRTLLHPQGHLVLSELCTQSKSPGYFFGAFPGWWLGDADNRTDQPFVSPDRWDEELKLAGFRGVQVLASDYEDTRQLCAAIVSQPARASTPTPRDVVVLGRDIDGTTSGRIIEALQSSGFTTNFVRFGDELPSSQCIISVLDLEHSVLKDVTRPEFLALQSMIQSTVSKAFLWLLPPTQIDCQNADTAGSIGLLRSLRTELNIPFITLEISTEDAGFPSTVTEVFRKVLDDDAEDLLPDTEYALQEGIVKTSRYHPFSLKTELHENTSASESAELTLSMGRPGLLDTLQWHERTRDLALGSDEVEVITKAVGLNFRDILTALGMLSVTSSFALGIEMSGIVRQVGRNVTHVSPGDRVYAVGRGGLLATNAVVASATVMRIPDGLSFEDAATMPTCFATVIRSLIEVGRMRQGDTILIHSACGGVGHAAIQVCQHLGVEIYATVSSEAKKLHLTETFGIRPDHIFHSRDDTFVADLMNATSDRGVDLVLNSLGGELLHASWKCVAECGKMVELGRRDLEGHSKLDMNPFLANRMYCCVEIAHLMSQEPKNAHRLLKKCVDMYERGAIGPINSSTIFDAADVQQAFRYMQKGNHIGKVVIRFPNEKSSIPRAPPSMHLDPQAAYLLVGGVGGLGQAIASWMVEKGARNLVFMSKSAGRKPEHQQFAARLEEVGCSVAFVQGQVQYRDDVSRAGAMSKAPIKGVIHLAMVLRDAPFINMTYEEWQEVTAAKVDGAWNLHDTFQERSLDFFVLASSVTSVFGTAGQSNYAAANSFLESFCQYRHALGLPASVISICPIDDAGFVSENASAMKSINAQGIHCLSKQELFDFLELAMRSSSHQRRPGDSCPNPHHVVMGLKSDRPLNDPNNHTSWRRDRRMGFYHNKCEDMISETQVESSRLQGFLTRVSRDKGSIENDASIELLATEIGRKIFSIMMRDVEDINIRLTVEAIGVDSLMAIELRRWWKLTFKVDISVLEIMGAGTLEGLGRLAAGKIADTVR